MDEPHAAGCCGTRDASLPVDAVARYGCTVHQDDEVFEYIKLANAMLFCRETVDSRHTLKVSVSTYLYLPLST